MTMIYTCEKVWGERPHDEASYKALTDKDVAGICWLHDGVALFTSKDGTFVAVSRNDNGEPRFNACKVEGSGAALTVSVNRNFTPLHAKVVGIQGLSQDERNTLARNVLSELEMIHARHSRWVFRTKQVVDDDSI